MLRVRRVPEIGHPLPKSRLGICECKLVLGLEEKRFKSGLDAREMSQARVRPASAFQDPPSWVFLCPGCGGAG